MARQSRRWLESRFGQRSCNATGRVTVTLTNGEEVKLNLPSAALREFDNGDRVTVTSQLALAENRSPSAGGGSQSDMQRGSQGGGASR